MLMALLNVVTCSTIISVFVQITSILSENIQEEIIPPAGCTCPESAAGETIVHPYCGHEMNQNCSRNVVYWCTGNNITVHLDCPHYTTVVVPQLKYAHYCVISPYTPNNRQCGFISDCTEDRGLCGFSSLQDVKDEIKKLPREVDRRVHCNLLHYPKKCKICTTDQPNMEMNENDVNGTHDNFFKSSQQQKGQGHKETGCLLKSD
jgi:hypothetical protein